LSQVTAEINRHREAMQVMGLDTENQQMDPAWLEAVKKIKVAP
jgi:hypothetical protein